MLRKSIGLMDLINEYTVTEEILPNDFKNLDINDDGNAVINQLESSIVFLSKRDIDISLQQKDNEIDCGHVDIDIDNVTIAKTKHASYIKLPFMCPTLTGELLPTELLALTLEKRAAILKKVKHKKDKKRKPQFIYSKHGKLSFKTYRNNKKRYEYNRW
eukprot:488768_1